MHLFAKVAAVIVLVGGLAQAPTAIAQQDEADALNTQVIQLYGEGKYAEAIPLAQRVLAIRERALGPDHPDVAASLVNLAELYEKQGRYGDAEELYKRALRIREKALGPDHPGIANSLMSLARLYQHQGRYGDAEELYKRALTIREKALGPENSDVAASLEGLADLYRSQGRAGEAESLDKRAQAVREMSGYLDARGGGGSPEPQAQNAAPAAPGSAPAKPLARMATPKDAPQPPPAAETKAGQTDWDVVPVFYGTDRQQQPNPKRVAYNSDRAGRLELGRALVTVPTAHQVPQIERPWAIRIPYFDVTIYEEAEDPAKHFTVQEIKQLSREDFLRLVRERLRPSARFKDHAVVFVHGYNTSFDNALYRTAQIAYDLKFDGAPFLYSWPSGGGIGSYTYDRESAEGAEDYLREFLTVVVKESGAKTISVIAHSMGNQPLLDALRDLKSVAPPDVVISQIILAAPDVDANNFSKLTKRIEGVAKNVTLYAASNDRALIASRNFWGHYRAGDVPPEGPLILPGIDTIDVTATSTDLFALNHSEYAQNNALLGDMAKLIATGERPPDKRLPHLKVIKGGKGDFWRYVP